MWECLVQNLEYNQNRLLKNVYKPSKWNILFGAKFNNMYAAQIVQCKYD